jgi:cytochrome b involved in lipid metabolism
MDANLLLAVLSAVLGVIIAYVLFKPKSTAAASKSRPEPRAFSRAEVATHNKEGDLWLILETKDGKRKNVYDLSAYADEHPGGEIIYKNAGGEASEGFKGPQHPPTVWDLIPEYCIGWIEE